MISQICPQLPGLSYICLQSNRPRGLGSDSNSQRAWTCFADVRADQCSAISDTAQPLPFAQQLPSSCSMGCKIEECLLEHSLVLGLQALARRFDEAVDGLVRDAQHICNLQQQSVPLRHRQPDLKCEAHVLLQQRHHAGIAAAATTF